MKKYPETNLSQRWCVSKPKKTFKTIREMVKDCLKKKTISCIDCLNK